MKRIAALCLLLSAGCSTAPVADLMDWVSPGRLPAAPGYHGGVGGQTVVAPPPVGLEAPQPPPPVPPPAGP